MYNYKQGALKYQSLIFICVFFIQRSRQLVPNGFHKYLKIDQKEIIIFGRLNFNLKFKYSIDYSFK